MPAGKAGIKTKTAIGVGGAALGFAGIYGAIMVFPKAVGDTVFPFLPEEMRPFASCCSSCSSVMSVIALVLFMLVKR